MKFFFPFLFFLGLCFLSIAQNTGELYWQDQPLNFSSLKAVQEEIPTSSRTVQIDVEALKNHLKATPSKFSTNARSTTSTTAITLPLPESGGHTFNMMKSHPMHPDLAAKYPEIQTWHGLSTEDGITAIALTISPQGLNAMISTAQFKRIFIKPLQNSARQTYLVYREAMNDSPTFQCVHQTKIPTGQARSQSASQENPQAQAIQLRQANNSGALGDRLRTHRLAMAANSGFSNLNGNTINSVLAKFVEFTNIQNLLYMREVSIRFELIPNTEKLIFINGLTTDMVADSYLDDGSDKDLAINQTTTDNIIGNENYDIGHVMNVRSGWGGAGPCSDSQKAAGSSWGLRALNHEIGHQFNCPHTDDSGTNYESRGIGNTVMGRNGALGNDDYFHISSALNIAGWVEANDYCISGTATNNTIPVVSVGNGGMHIPKSTPFQLSGSAFDPDPNTNLLYNWQQYNNGTSFTIVNGEVIPQGNYPAFRNYFPTGNGNIRTVPRLADIINDSQPFAFRSDSGIDSKVFYELLPDYGRNLTFRLVARDYEMTGGAFDYAELSFEVDGTAGPFLVNSPNMETDNWTTGDNVVVTWDVAGTDQAPVNCTIVDIRLSIDGGWTYPYLLEAAVPNNGSVNFILPEGIPATTKARIKVECANYDNVRFFDISNQNFTINSACRALGGILSPTRNVTALPGNSDLNLNLNTFFGENPEQANFKVRVDAPRGRIALNNTATGNCIDEGQNLNYENIAFEVDKTGEYSFAVSWDDPNGGYFAIYSSGDYNPNSSCDNFVASTSDLNRGGTAVTGSETVFLNEGSTYHMVFHAWFTDSVFVNVNFTSNNDGNVVILDPSSPPTPAGDYNYIYAAVATNTNQVVALEETADFTGLSVGTYHIYGLSYKSANSPPNTVDPSDFINQNFNDVSNSGLCASFSENFVKLKIEGCTVVGIVAESQSDCSPNNNTYSQNLIIHYTDAPTMGNLVVNGQNFSITGSPQTITLSNLTADGQTVGVTANFSDNSSCVLTNTDVFTAPNACDEGGQDCATVTLSCGQVYNGNTNGGTNNRTTYPCIDNLSFLGKEVIHKITTTSTSNILATISNVNAEGGTLAVFIYGDCANDCLAQFDSPSDTDVEVRSVPAGTYYFIIDGLDNANGSYTLTVNCDASNCATPPPATGTIPTNMYQISGDMTSAGQVISPSSVVFKASNSITLSPSFTVEAGAIFEAVIEDCASFQEAEVVNFRAEEIEAIDFRPATEQSYLQVHPNPFSNQTTISYQIEKPTAASITIHDVNGRLVEQLITNQWLLEGTHKITFQAQNQPKGIYLVVFRTKNVVLSKRLVLIK